MSKTFQRRIIFYNLLIVICIAGAVSFYNYRSYREDVITTATRNSTSAVKILSNRLDLAYTEMVNLVQNCAERKALFFSTTINGHYSGNNSYMSLYAASVLRDYCAISGYNQYIYKITLYYKDKLLLQAGSNPGALEDPQDIMNAPWFKDRLSRQTSQYALSVEDTPFPFGKSSNPKILPFVRPLKYSYDSRPEDAWVFLGISPRLYADALNTMDPEQIIYAVTQDGDVISSLNGHLYDVSGLIRSLLINGENSGNLRAVLNHDDCIITWQKHDISGLLFFEVLPIKDLNYDHGVINRTILIIFFFCIAIGLTLSFLISNLLGAPIRRLTKRLDLISEGNFERDIFIETDDEIGMIGRQINQMSGRISELLDTRVQSEKEKKDMEIKMLQAQINPHFLYNTLDSIKWIATIQKNSGIVQVVTALSSLLKNMAKGFNEKVTLRQELDFLQNYVIIEKIRYIELFDVETDVEDEKLYDARIIKLTLQPIVENAIFSGIEPSGRAGLIRIHAYTKAGVLYVTVTDNGIGISPENIKNILTDTARVTKSNMSGIGLPNVDRRLKLVYGEDYGLTIESEVDRYTKVTISLPLEI